MNMEYLHENQINGYIPDNQFRSRDPKFKDQKEKYGKRHQSLGKSKAKSLIPYDEFQFDPVKMVCICPAGEQIRHRGVKINDRGQRTAYFESRLLQCRHCMVNNQCMKNPESANHQKDADRQVSFTLSDQRAPTYTDWMKHRMDSPKGKQIYSHRMSVVEPVFGNTGTNKWLSRLVYEVKARFRDSDNCTVWCIILRS
ncbi:transposase [Nitrincola schmidtii]|uniref:transposase n=1 Tax=Nitrincola schmidtii TaxID=1730894 RepID=UPI0019826A2D|nr:transposase [Nitrincola schmidtii]